jgi:peroxiredoxin Q/BCP
MVRTTYLIDADGKIAQVWDNVRVKDHAALVLAAARAL